MNFGKVKDWIYNLSTSDKYAESRKSFNRVNKPDERNLLYNNNYSSVSLLNSPTGETEGASTLNVSSEGIYEVKLAWRHIKNWLSKYAPDIYSSLQSPCTEKDLAEFQNDLKSKLPECMLEFYRLTDGQSEFNRNESGGAIFGLKLMPIDEIVVMLETWRKVAHRFNMEVSHKHQSIKGPEKIQTRATSNGPNATPDLRKLTKASHVYEDMGRIPKQRSIPPGAIHETFAHPQWIPIITDEVGNCIGVDLAPPSDGCGTWGQVILFGREFDTKYLISDNLGDFLLIVANDLELGNWRIVPPIETNSEDLTIGSEGELVFFDRNTEEEKNYLDVLKERSLNKWLSEVNRTDPKNNAQIDEILTLVNNTNPKLTYRDNKDDFINMQLANMEDFTRNDAQPSFTSNQIMQPTSHVDSDELKSKEEALAPKDASKEALNDKTERNSNILEDVEI